MLQNRFLWMIRYLKSKIENRILILVSINSDCVVSAIGFNGLLINFYMIQNNIFYECLKNYNKW